VIHAMHHALHHQGDHHTDPQDIRNMGGLKGKMPITFWTFIIYTLAISGVPLTSGFLSKDAVLAGTLAFAGISGHVVIPIIGFLVAGLTAFYMFRLVILTFLGDHRDGHRLEHVHESPLVMTLPLMILAALSLFFFFSFNPLDAADGWFAAAMGRPASVVPVSIAPTAPGVFEEALHHAHVPAMLLSLTVAGIGILVAFLTYWWKRINADRVAEAVAPVHTFLLNKWYFDELYQAVVIRGVLALTAVLRWFDNTVIDGMVNGSGWVTRLVSYLSGKFDMIVIDGIVNMSAYFSGLLGLVFRKLQTGKVQTYIVFVVFSVLVFYFVFRLV
jgi:NADH-quinone oxidoreductase subunit L